MERRRTVSIDEAIKIAIAHHQAGRFPEAEAIYQDILRADGSNADALRLYGALSMQAGRVDVAHALMEKGLKFDPNNAEAHNNFGVLLKAKNFVEEAAARFRMAIFLNPSCADAYNNLGVILQDQGELCAASDSFRAALLLNPAFAEAYCNLALVFQETNDFNKANEYYQLAITHKPDLVDAHFRFGVNLILQGKFDESIVRLDKALDLRSDFAEATYNRAVSYLSLGRYNEGWPDYESRFDPSIKPNVFTALNFEFPKWRGQSITGKSIVVVDEQGIGDDIRFCRYASALKTLGAARVTLVCKDRLLTLFSRMKAVDALVARSDIATVETHDFWIYAQSVPMYCGTTVDTIPADIPYLFADTALIDRTANALCQSTDLKIGICWKGNAAYNADRERSPGLGFFEPLFGAPGVRIFTLLPNSRAELIARAGDKAVDIGHEVDEFTAPFEETAALIMNLDLVITCDTSICHLAGALGKPVWLVLPYRAHWVWMTDREDSPWYPTMRLFRQRERGNWAEVFDRVAKKMRAVLAGESPLVWPIK